MKSRQNILPPDWIRRLLQIFLDDRTLESCLGDLEEKFRMRMTAQPAWKAKLLYSVEGIGFLKIRRRRQRATTQTTLAMISHTLLFFSRLIRKDLSYYLVSMLGLAISLASFILITLYIQDELSYDRFHEHKDRIYRVTTHIRVGEVNYDEASSPFPAAAALKSEIAEIEEAVRIYPQDIILESGEKKFQERVLFADENLFDVFTFPILAGEMRSALAQPGSVVLTAAAAKKYFGTTNPLGKNLVAAGQTLVVAAVVEDVPVQSHIKFDVIVPLSFMLNIWKSQTGVEGRENKWYWTGAHTYVLLRPGATASEAAGKLPGIVNKYFPERYREKGALMLQPLTGIHLNSHLDVELEPGGTVLYVRLFSIVAAVIMIVCTINLINLAYFKIGSRIREVGIRKFLGQSSGRIVAQLSIESTLMGILAFVLALAICAIALQGFNLLVQKNLQIWSPAGLFILITTLLILALICILAVVRPALRYARSSSSHLLLKAYRSPDNSRMRNVLIGLQVGFSFVLLVFSFIISGQIDFFRKKDLGFTRENVVVVSLDNDVLGHLDAFRNELKKNKKVAEVAGGSVPGSGYDGWRFVAQGGSYEKPIMLPYTNVDYNFLKTMNIKLLMGRDFDPEARNDSLIEFLINKRAAVELGWVSDPLNKTLEIFAPGTTQIMVKGRVIGLIDDYHFESLHKPVKPVVISTGPYFPTALIRMNGEVSEESLAVISSTWKKFSGNPFTYHMLDQQLEKLYTNETQLSNVILFFTFIALYLTSYGLFAMSSLLFGSKLKEVAIRKVFGADQFRIVKLLYSKYALFNMLAILAGLPVAIYLGNLWLDTFEFRIALGYGMFLKAGLCILLAGLFSVTYYLAKVALTNPVQFLRSE